jgi:predicted Zn-dependent protease
MSASADPLPRAVLDRRGFLRLAAATGSSIVLPTLVAGCATDPVTGQSSLVGLSEQEEIQIDKQAAPQQFSADYGAVQDAQLNQYVAAVGQSLWTKSHRPRMPYSARVLNANYINAYTFPGGTMATTRGIMLELQSEDELAGLLGHEIGHVNARHAAERAGRQQAASVAIGAAQVGLSVFGLGGLASAAGQAGEVGASALLASYSRDDEREADALGMEYMTRAAYNADGMVGLMDVLRRESGAKPSMIETMFSSHPMSDERYATAKREAGSKYAASRAGQLKRQSYMDNTARLRALKPAIEAEQRGQTLLAKGRPAEAEAQFAQALKLAPNDYTGLILMSQVQLAQKKFTEAEVFVDRAVAVYPSEAQSQKLGGIVKLALRKPELAYQRFDAYDKALPGSTSTLFFKGMAMEQMQNQRGAAHYYVQFLQAGGQGQPAQYSAQRLKQWGVIK